MNDGEIPGRRRSAGDGHAPLTVEQILALADDHRQRTGRWPNQGSRDGPTGGEARTEEDEQK